MPPVHAMSDIIPIYNKYIKVKIFCVLEHSFQAFEQIEIAECTEKKHIDIVISLEFFLKVKDGACTSFSAFVILRLWL